MKQNLLKKFMQFSYGSWIGLVMGLATTMLTTRILAPEAFGKASMFDLFLQIGLIIAIFGTDQSFVRFFYEEEENKRGALLYNTLRLPILTTTFLLAIVFIFYKSLSNFLIGNESLIFTVWIAVGILAQLLFRYGQLVIRMQQKGNMYSILQILQRVFNFTFILLFFYTIGSSFKVLIYSSVISLVLLSIISIFFGKQFWKISNLTIKGTKHTQSDIIRFGAPLVLTLFITWLFESFDKMALRQWSSFEELGQYAAAMKLVALVMVLKNTFSTFWTPVAYEKFENDPQDKKFFQDISTIVSFFMFLVAIITIVGKDIIITLLGSDYSTAATIMPFLVFMPLLYTISQTTVMGINFYKKTYWYVIISAIACATNIIGNWILVPKQGAIGASIATAFSFIVFFTLRTQISLRYFKVNYPLLKIYTMVTVISIYAYISIYNSNMLKNISLGLIPLSLLIILYYKDLKMLYFNRKKLLS